DLGRHLARAGARAPYHPGEAPMRVAGCPWCDGPVLRAGEWKPEEHPRDEHGRFATAGSVGDVGEWSRVKRAYGATPFCQNLSPNGLVDVGVYLRRAMDTETKPGQQLGWVSDVEVYDYRAGRLGSGGERLAYHRERTFSTRDAAEVDVHAQLKCL